MKYKNTTSAEKEIVEFENIIEIKRSKESAKVSSVWVENEQDEWLTLMCENDVNTLVQEVRFNSFPHPVIGEELKSYKIKEMCQFNLTNFTD